MEGQTPLCTSCEGRTLTRASASQLPRPWPREPGAHTRSRWHLSGPTAEAHVPGSPVADVLSWLGICQLLLAPHTTHNIFEPQDPLAELNSCLAAPKKGVEPSLDRAKLRTCDTESILGSGGIYLTWERPSHSWCLKCSLGVPRGWAHRSRKGRDWEETGLRGSAVMEAGRETNREMMGGAGRGGQRDRRGGAHGLKWQVARGTREAGTPEGLNSDRPQRSAPMPTFSIPRTHSACSMSGPRGGQGGPRPQSLQAPHVQATTLLLTKECGAVRDGARKRDGPHPTFQPWSSPALRVCPSLRISVYGNPVMTP